MKNYTWRGHTLTNSELKLFIKGLEHYHNNNKSMAMLEKFNEFMTTRYGEPYMAFLLKKRPKK